MPISGMYKINGVGDLLAGRVEPGIVKPCEEVICLPTHSASNFCVGKVFTVEMQYQRAEQAKPGDNVGLNIKGLDKQNMLRVGDVMVYKKDTTPGQTKEFDAQFQASCVVSAPRAALASCVVSAPRAALPSSSGRWAKRQVAS